MRKSLLLFVFLYSTLSAQAPLELKLIPVARGFTSPIGIYAPADGTGRLFVIEQGGKIKIVKNEAVLQIPFLDVSSKLDGLNIAYSEKGLLGLAFHPGYKTNGRFFIYYSSPTTVHGMDHKSVLAEYKVSSNNPDVADPSSEKIIMEIQEPESNHNGGQIVFGPDGFMYIGLGDGGGANDEHGEKGNGQNLNTWLGKILRIDVDHGSPYKIPADNPFAGSGNIKPEIWAYGLRNPWRFSFDKATGKLFCADVGQNKYEEIDIIEKARNYGWRIMEGFHCFNPSKDCDRTGLSVPVCEYAHSEGISIIGGYMYRGMEFPSLHGYYLFGDWTGKTWYLNYNEQQKEWIRGSINIDGKKKNDIDGKINSFGEDEKGNIYIVTQKLIGPKSPTGVIYKFAL